jgi:heterodisulfide reductase subunit C
MDYTPNQVMRMVQLGLEEEMLRSRTIWVCAACQTCTARCPNDIDIAHLMDALRQLSHESGVAPAEPNVVTFHEAVLRSIRRHGRLFELGMVAGYKLSTRDFLSDARLGWEMFRRGKLKFLPARVKARHEIREMFRQPERKG